MTQLQQKFTLPAAMAAKLEVVRRRTLRVRIGTAIVAAIGVLLAAMAVSMLVDWLATIYEFHWRAVLTYSAWTAAGVTLLAWALTAWRHTRRVEGVAAKIDREIPELEERWSTVTEIYSSDNNGSSNAPARKGQGSAVHPAMFRQVSKEAQSWTPRVEPDRVIPLDGLIRALLFLTAITTILGIAVVFDSHRTTVLLRRFWQPYTAISATEITDLSGDMVVGRGESLEIGANLAGAPVEEALLLLQPVEGEAKTITLTPRGDTQDQLTHRLRAVKEPMRYRLRAGDGQTPWYEIAVADRPQLADVRVKLTPPAYTRKEAETINKLPRRVTVLEGSHLEISLKPKQQLKSLALKFSPELSEELTPDEKGWYRWESTLTKNIAFRTLLTEEHGLGNLRPPLCEIKIRPDRPPVVKILTPNSEMAVRPDDTIPVTFVASDDVGVYQAELVVYDESRTVDGKPAVLDRIAVPLGDQQGAVKVKATVKLDLSRYETTDGSELSFSIRVREDRGQQYLAENRSANNGASAQLTSDGQTVELQAGTNSPTNDQPEQLASVSPSESQSDATQSDTAQSNAAQSADQQAMTAPAAVEDSTTRTTANEETVSLSAQEATDSDPNKPNALASAESPAASGDGLQNPKSSPSAAANEGERSSPSEETAANAANAMNSPTDEASAAQESSAVASPTSANEDGVAKNDSSADSDGTSPDPSDMPTEASDEGRTTTTGRQALNATPQPEPQQPDATAKESTQSADIDPQTADSNPQSASSDQPSGNQPQQSEGQANPTQSNSAQSDSTGSESKQSESAQSDSAQESSNQNSGNRNSKNSPTDQDSASQESAPSPGNPMTQRELDIEQAAQSSSSQRMRLKIDEWAGSYDGQQRQKLEIAIAPRLEELDRALEKAQQLSRSVLDEIDTGKPWASKHGRDIQRADEQIEAAIKVVESLENETYGTPYAFIGLQLVDIKQAHISLARRDFWKSLQTQDTVRVDAVRNGWTHTTRARELLVLLTERFERTKIEYKMADSVENIKKMYRVFVEDSMALLRQDGEGSRYNRKVAEFDLDEEYLKRLEEVIKMRNEMRAELARILADDPRLLRRFLDAQRNRQVVLRNDLDRLIEDQGELNRETRAWAAAGEDERPGLAKILIGRHVESAQDIAIAAAELHDRFETWSPLGKEVDDADFQATAEVLQEISTATRELSQAGLDFVADSIRAKKIESQPEVATDESDDVAATEADTEADDEAEPEVAENPFNPNEASEQISLDAQQLYERFTRLEVLLRQIGGRKDRLEIASFATNRLLETRKLIEQTSAWIRQLKQQQAGNYHRAAEVAQYRLATRTDTLAGKLANLEQTMAGLLQNESNMLPEAIAVKARGLLAALDEQAAPNQLAAVYALRRNQMSRATSREESALEALQLAGKLYDEMVEESIKELDKLPVQDPIASLLDDPTLDDLLRELEQEIPIEEALGIPARPSNLQIMSDWLRSGGDNALMTGGNRRMMADQMRRQEQMRQRQLEQAYRRAVARALNEAEAEDLVKDMPKLARETADWNRLASQLEDDLRQGRDKAPPERYRRAIEQYFRQISGSKNDSDQP